MTNSQQTKWQSLLRGETVIASDVDMDVWEKQDHEAVNRLASLPNPNQCGVLDRWKAFLVDFSLRAGDADE